MLLLRMAARTAPREALSVVPVEHGVKRIEKAWAAPFEKATVQDWC
jgi:hypothetical protein